MWSERVVSCMSEHIKYRSRQIGDLCLIEQCDTWLHANKNAECGNRSRLFLTSDIMATVSTRTVHRWQHDVASQQPQTWHQISEPAVELRTEQCPVVTTVSVCRSMKNNNLMDDNLARETASRSAASELPNSLWNQKVHCRIHKSSALVLSWNRSIQFITQHLITLKDTF
jgi:hypothetical protein